MYHSKNGLFFERLQDGSVHILRTYDARNARDDNVVFDITLTESEWASVVFALAAKSDVSEWTPTAEQIAHGRELDYCGGITTPESDEQVIARLRTERRTGRPTFAWQTTIARLANERKEDV